MIQEHGGNICGYNNILDFSANINPLGLPESVKKAVIGSVSDCEKYPDPFCTELRKRLAEYENTAMENIVCGNGADDLIYRISYEFAPRKAVICAPSFGEYRKALAEAGCGIYEYPLREENDFALTEDIIDFVDSSADMIILCSPNNPTGRLIAPEILERLADKCFRSGIILVADECFTGFNEKGEIHSLKQFMNKQCIILKAFTKLFAMAGLRLGYAICGSTETAERLSRRGQFWSVSVPAQAAGIAALNETEYISETIRLIRREREFLRTSLQEYNLRVYPSDANYLLFRADTGLDDRLLSENIMIRNCCNYSGLGSGFYRIAVRTHEENTRLVEALGRCFNG